MPLGRRNDEKNETTMKLNRQIGIFETVATSSGARWTSKKLFLLTVTTDPRWRTLPSVGGAYFGLFFPAFTFVNSLSYVGHNKPNKISRYKKNP